MKKNILFLLIVLFAGCTKPLILKRISFDETLAEKNRNYSNNYYINYALGDSFIYKNEISIKGNLDISPFFFFDSYLFVGDLAGKFYIIELEENKIIGENKFNGSINVPPILSNYRLFIPLNNYDENYATLYFYDILNNKVLSQTNIDGKIDYKIIKYKENIIVINNRGELYKLNLAGTLESKHKLLSELKSEPILINEKIYYIGNKGELFSFSLLENKAKIELENMNMDKLLSYNEEIVVSNNNSYSIIKEEDISHSKLSNISLSKMQSGVTDSNDLFFIDYDGNVICINKNNRNLKWESNLGGFTNIPLVLTKDYLLVTNSIGEIIFVNKDSGQVYSRIKVEERIKTMPQIYENRIYFGVAKGLIKVYEKANNK
ncbi:MAG: PQQ-binding-like beta-propeller repeat protein [Melioribacteraceae bacterium]|nr:PQQ-binding-like beta-propeller repeat protein [Melioribacteraceae bacterium]